MPTNEIYASYNGATNFHLALAKCFVKWELGRHVRVDIGNTSVTISKGVEENSHACTSGIYTIVEISGPSYSQELKSFKTIQ